MISLFIGKCFIEFPDFFLQVFQKAGIGAFIHISNAYARVVSFGFASFIMSFFFIKISLMPPAGDFPYGSGGEKRGCQDKQPQIACQRIIGGKELRHCTAASQSRHELKGYRQENPTYSYPQGVFCREYFHCPGQQKPGYQKYAGTQDYPA